VLILGPLGRVAISLGLTEFSFDCVDDAAVGPVILLVLLPVSRVKFNVALEVNAQFIWIYY
jgi:hypothetical protein